MTLWSRKRKERTAARLSQAQQALESSEKAMAAIDKTTRRANALADYLATHREQNHYAERLQMAYRAEKR